MEQPLRQQNAARLELRLVSPWHQQAQEAQHPHLTDPQLPPSDPPADDSDTWIASDPEEVEQMAQQRKRSRSRAASQAQKRAKSQRVERPPEEESVVSFITDSSIRTPRTIDNAEALSREAASCLSVTRTAHQLHLAVLRLLLVVKVMLALPKKETSDRPVQTSEDRLLSKAQRLAGLGRLGAAARVLARKSVTTSLSTEEQLAQAEALHPQEDLTEFPVPPSRPEVETYIEVDNQHLKRLVKDHRKGACPGASGWTEELLHDALSNSCFARGFVTLISGRHSRLYQCLQLDESATHCLVPLRPSALREVVGVLLQVLLFCGPPFCDDKQPEF